MIVMKLVIASLSQFRPDKFVFDNAYALDDKYDRNEVSNSITFPISPR